MSKCGAQFLLAFLCAQQQLNTDVDPTENTKIQGSGIQAYLSLLSRLGRLSRIIKLHLLQNEGAQSFLFYFQISMAFSFCHLQF
jgi:hypothetical protein